MKKPSPLRFTRKLYGRGRTPSTRQGRAVCAGYIILIIIGIKIFGQTQSTNINADPELLAWWVLAASLLLTAISSFTGPKPKRQRGPKSVKDNNVTKQ